MLRMSVADLWGTNWEIFPLVGTQRKLFIKYNNTRADPSRCVKTRNGSFFWLSSWKKGARQIWSQHADTDTLGSTLAIFPPLLRIVAGFATKNVVMFLQINFRIICKTWYLPIQIPILLSAKSTTTHILCIELGSHVHIYVFDWILYQSIHLLL